MIIYILGLLASFLAGAWFIINPPRDRSWIYLFLSAGGAYLMAIIFTHILPELFEHIPGKAGYVLLIGFLVQIMLENYSKGIEHGHAHVGGTKSALLVSYAALCLHELIEGMPLALNLTGNDAGFNQQLTTGIMLHKIPVAITLSTLLMRSGFGPVASLMWLGGFILCTIAGSGLQLLIDHYSGINTDELIFISLGLTVGILLHVSTTILFESSDHHHLSPSRIVVIAMGIALGVMS